MEPKLSIVSLVALNVVVLLCVAATPKPDRQKDVQSLVRARAIELVDDKGRIRASLGVEKNGEAVFRMRDVDQTIRIKLGASRDGSALLLLDDSTNPGMHVLARHGTTLTLLNPDGRKRVVTP